MEPVLTNHCRMDRQALLRANTWMSRRTRLLGWIGAGCFVALAALRLFTSGIDALVAVELAGAVAYPILGYTIPFRWTKLQLQRLQESRHSDHVDVTTVFSEEGIAHWRDGSGDPPTIYYDSVKTVAVLSGLILLWTKGRQFVLLDAARFENGTEADFWKLMNEKCPKAVPKTRRP